MFGVHCVPSFFDCFLQRHNLPSIYNYKQQVRAASKRIFTCQQYCGHFNQGNYNIFLVLTRKSTQPRQKIWNGDFIKLELIWVHSITKKMFSEMCCLKNGSNLHIQNGGHKTSAESENAQYLSNQSSYENK